MKKRWFYKFIVYVQLIVMMLYLVWMGIVYFRGTIYGSLNGIEVSESYYSAFPMIEILDKCRGVILVLLGVAAYFIRVGLLKKEGNAPRNYLIYLLSIAMESAIYSVLVSLITRTNLFRSAIYSLCLTFIYFFICLSYFKMTADEFR